MIASINVYFSLQLREHFIFSLSVNKGIGVENIHYLNDGLWQMKKLDR